MATFVKIFATSVVLIAMSIIGSIIPAVSSGLVHGSQQNAAVRPDSANAANRAVANAVLTGQATVVTLTSSNDKKRVASYGESRGVDEAFEKQEAKEKVEKKEKDQKSSAQGSFKTTA